jgi:transposase
MIFCSVVMVSSNRRGGALRNPDQLRAPPRCVIPVGTRTPSVRLWNGPPSFQHCGIPNQEEQNDGKNSCSWHRPWQERLQPSGPHRARDRLVGERTALINQFERSYLERGIVVPQGRGKLERELAILIDENQGAGLSPRVVKLICDMRTQWSELDRRIEEFNKEFVAFVKADEGARLLVSIPGIGATIASALIAAIGKAESFTKGRDLAARLGLVPKQSTTGERPRLLGISKRGNTYLRKLLIHGARSALLSIAERDTPLRRWAKGLLARAHKKCRCGSFS